MDAQGGSCFESSIERIIREATPEFFVGTSFLSVKFHNRRKWQCPVRFTKGDGVLKYDLSHPGRRFRMAFPDFVLLDSAGMERFRQAEAAASRGLPYKRPFTRNERWFCEVFGDYWHGPAQNSLPPLEHEREVQKAYEENGYHVLILWEHDIVNNFNAVCLPKLRDFIAAFQSKCGVVEKFPSQKIRHTLSDISLACLTAPDNFRALEPGGREAVVAELADCYGGLLPRYPERWEMEEDWENFRGKECPPNSRSGNKTLDYFIRSKFDSKRLPGRSVNEIWRNRQLMEDSIIQLLECSATGINATRLLNAMLYRGKAAMPSGLNQNLLAARLRKYAVPGGIFYDPCAGWGGRLLAAWKLGMTYLAIDANPKLVEELRRLAAFIGYADAEIIHGDSAAPADVARLLRERKADLVFTCPPYGDKEDYGDDPCQSIIRHRDDWHNGFLGKMLELALDNCRGKTIICVDNSVNLGLVRNLEFRPVPFGEVIGNADDFYEVLPAVAETSRCVVCRLCGKSLTRLGVHLRAVHGIDSAEYRRQFPNARVISKAAAEIVSRANHAKSANRKFAKRVAYRLPDGTLVGRVDAYLRAWGLAEPRPEDIVDAKAAGYLPRRELHGVEGVDYVACRICGERKGNLAQHIRLRHGLSNAEYRERYGGEIYSAKAKEKQHTVALAKWTTQRKRDAAKKSLAS